MKITVTLTKEAKSTLKTLPIASQSAFNDLYHRLEMSVPLSGEQTLSNTGFLYFMESRVSIIFTREQAKAFLTQETIYRVNIVKIFSSEPFERTFLEELVKDQLIASSSPSAETSNSHKIGQLGVKSLDQAGRWSIVLGLIIATVLLAANTLDSKDKNQPENSTHSPPPHSSQIYKDDS